MPGREDLYFNMAARYTEDRIDNIAQKIVDKLSEDDLILTSANSRKTLSRKIGRVIYQDQVTEFEIEQEAIKVLEPYSQKVAPGSAQWEAMYLQAKERIAQKKNFEL